MNRETELKLQAYLDGELPQAERADVIALLERDPQARELHDLLGSVRATVRDNEPEYKLNETREFYWSKIEREILRQQSELPREERAHGLAWDNWWVRLAAGFAVAVLILAIVRPGDRPTFASRHVPQEIESPVEDVGAITFHSKSANMTVVWVQTQFFEAK